jgi:hypothetical protein
LFAIVLRSGRLLLKVAFTQPLPVASQGSSLARVQSWRTLPLIDTFHRDSTCNFAFAGTATAALRAAQATSASTAR